MCVCAEWFKDERMTQLLPKQEIVRYFEKQLPSHPKLRNVALNILTYLLKHCSPSQMPKFVLRAEPERGAEMFELRVHYIRRLFLSDLEKLIDIDSSHIVGLGVGSSREHRGISLSVLLSAKEHASCEDYAPVLEKEYIAMDAEPDLSMLEREDQSKAMRVIRFVTNIYPLMPLVTVEISRHIDHEYEISFGNMPQIDKRIIDYFMHKFEHMVNSVRFFEDEDNRALQFVVSMSKTGALKPIIHNAKRSLPDESGSRDSYKRTKT